MSSGDFERLDGWKLLAERQGLYRDGKYIGLSGVALVKVDQRAEFNKTIHTDVAPALLTNTHLWNLASDEPVVVASHWLVQGFAHPLVPAVAQQSTSFPIAASMLDVRTGLGARTQRQLMGNAMHVSAVGSWLLYNLSSIDFSAVMRP